MFLQEELIHLGSSICVKGQLLWHVYFPAHQVSFKKRSTLKGKTINFDGCPKVNRFPLNCLKRYVLCDLLFSSFQTCLFALVLFRTKVHTEF